jgi:hypothetical protein
LKLTGRRLGILAAIEQLGGGFGVQGEAVVVILVLLAVAVNGDYFFFFSSGPNLIILSGLISIFLIRTTDPLLYIARPNPPLTEALLLSTSSTDFSPFISVVMEFPTAMISRVNHWSAGGLALLGWMSFPFLPS